MESYTTPGGAVGSPVEADTYILLAAGLGEVSRAFIIGTQIYTLYNRQYLYRYDLPSMTNGTLIWNAGTAKVHNEGIPELFYF
jgi:hypothetical protein